MPSRRLAALSLALTAMMCLSAAPSKQALPLVPCASDGQQGPLDPPSSKAPTPTFPPALASRLAYYAVSQYGGGANGVVGPRGWHCAYLYGSSGDYFLLAPQPLAARPEGTVLKGWGIEVAYSMGSTSGRFEAAELAGRLFPSAKKFVDGVVAEGVTPAGEFPRKPFPTDRLTYLSPTMVLYETPRDREGLGTKSWLAKSPEPIRGFVGFYPDSENSTLHLSMRLPPSLRGLEPVIINDVRNPSR